VDGAVHSLNKFGSFSVVYRDEIRVFMGASTIKIPGIIDPLVLESLACREALALAADFICNKILVSSYCKGIIKDINGRFRGINATIIKQIELKREFYVLLFIHEGRQSNIFFFEAFLLQGRPPQPFIT
jgi:hypothetical protein